MPHPDLASLKKLERRVEAVSASDTAHIFSVDVEEWFQVGAFEHTLSRDDWPTLESRAALQTEKILALLDVTGVKASFFCLGWVAERAPALIRQIVDQGHEIAAHGMDHKRIYQLSTQEFKADIDRCKKILEDTSGKPVLGYRAPSFSMTLDKWHFFELMQQTGYAYSSSVFPAKTDHYGIPDAPKVPFYPLEGQDFVEVPMTVARLGSALLPASGGGYFRLLPSPVAMYLMRRAVKQNDSGVVFYMHPWEADPEQPYVRSAPLKSRVRHYIGQGRLLGRLKTLLTDWSFMPAHAYLKHVYGWEAQK